ncbi:hypothetical protein BGZ65_010682 [Modicella reniformis]|uniref:F-box domain-containing protein n=1 Tax=Modicella reniformis TaxID=1440133 RepID=A0A9P6J413_9FUNG|nr:hypothetical protein BGZ65_010682 [Modicella reniformis]
MTPPLGTPMTTVQVNKVFSIPELADQICQYLRFVERLRLRLVSKALYEVYRPNLGLSIPSFTYPDPVAMADNWIVRLCGLNLRVRSLNLEIGMSSPSQRSMLETIYQHCSESVHHLKIEYRCDDLAILENILVKLPHIQDLSIEFTASANVMAFPKVLIEARKVLHHLFEDKITHLQALRIRFGVKHEMSSWNWSLFKEMLTFCPQLRTLSLTGISFVEFHRHIIQEDLDDDDEDQNGINDTLEQLDGMSLQYGEQQPKRTFSLPLMQTLEFSQCIISEGRLKGMSRIFPNVQTLRLTGCGGFWLLALTESAPDKAVLFVQLRSLTFWTEFQTSREELVVFIRGRPHLASFETDSRTITREGLLEFAHYCSSPESSSTSIEPSSTSIEPSSTSIESDSSQATSKVAGSTIDIRHKFKRLAVQTYWSTAYTRQELEQFYGELCFRELEYIFMQTEYLSMNMFPFAKTLRSLHIGGGEHSLVPRRVDELNKILRQLPALEVLHIERYLDSYEIFAGMGREPSPSSSHSEQEQNQQQQQQQQQQSLPCQVDWLNEGPFLHQLEFLIHLPKEDRCLITREDGSYLPISKICHGATINLRELEQQIVDRFVFLEKLRVQVHTQIKLPDRDEFDRWRAEVWKKRGDEGSQTPRIELEVRRL